MSNCDSCSNKESSNLNNIQDNKIKNIIAVMIGIVCITVSGTSPVPGGISIIK